MCPGHVRMSIAFERARPIAEQRIREKHNLPQVDLRIRKLNVAQRGHLMGLLQRLKGRFSDSQKRVLRQMFPEGQNEPLSCKKVAELLRQKCIEEFAAKGKRPKPSDFEDYGATETAVKKTWKEIQEMIASHLVENFDPAHPEGKRGNGVSQIYPSPRREPPYMPAKRMAVGRLKMEASSGKRLHFSPIAEPDLFNLLFIEPRQAGTGRHFDSWGDFVKSLEEDVRLETGNRAITVRAYPNHSISFSEWNRDQLLRKKSAMEKDLKGNSIESGERSGKFEEYFAVLDALAAKYRTEIQKTEQALKTPHTEERDRNAAELKLQDYEERIAKLYDFFILQQRKKR